MSEGTKTAMGYGGLAIAGLLIPLAIAFAHSMRGEIIELRREVTTELRLTREAINSGLADIRDRQAGLESRVTRNEVTLAMEARRERRR